MRLLFFLTLSINILLTWAQVPNGGFDNWTNRSIDQLDDWNSAGLVQKSSDATHGNSAIRLDTRAGDQAFGIVTNADLSDELSGGQPYTDIPLVMRFDVKYNLAQGDVAKVLAIFKLQGQGIGAVDFTMNGNTADTFVNISYPIQWATQINPDSVIVVISSADFESPSFNGDGYVIIDNIEFKSFATVKDSISNRSFEDWGSFDIPHPESWYTTDLYLQDILNLPISFGAASQADHIQSGAASLKLKNIRPDADIIPGVAITGASVEDVDKPSFPINRRWTQFQGLYKYQPDNGDGAVLAATFFSGGNLIGAAQLVISDSSRMDEYTYFSAPVQYFSPAIPDSATVILSSADLENPQGENSQLWIDNISFTNHTASVEIQSLLGLSVYPNPMTNQLIIEHQNLEQIDVKVYNSKGQLVITTTRGVLNTADLPAGIYFIDVEQDGVARLKERIIKL